MKQHDIRQCNIKWYIIRWCKYYMLQNTKLCNINLQY